MSKYYLLCLLLNYFITCSISENTLVTLPNGKIKGREAVTFKNTTYYAFQEIPYAAPPVGEFRLKPPAPLEDWNDVLDTTKNTKICYQATGDHELQTEDCLYLNVYTPVVPDSGENLPVLVFVHGGQFLYGSGIYDEHGPEFFMDTKEIVVVTVNYRLGALGFLSTVDDVIPGNYGLKDQRAALEWIQENIALFGGDPAKVTLSGQSAGSASVSYHISSRKSEGLFRSAICESGTVLTPWSYQRYAKDIAYQAGTLLDSTFTTSNSSKELLEILQKVSVTDFQQVTGSEVKIPSKYINTGFVFAAVYESGDDAFVSELSYEALANGDFVRVPILMGINSEESLDSAKDLVSLKKLMATYDDDLSIIVNDDFHLSDETEKVKIGAELRKVFTDGQFQDDLPSSVRFISNSRYDTNIIKYAQIVSNFTDVYFYEFSYDGELGNNPTFIEGADSVAHSEELQYLWRVKQNDDVDSFPETDVLVHNRLVKLWVNFITKLNPTPDDTDELLENITWPTVSPNNYQYLNINDTLEIKIDPKENVFKRMDEIYQTYGIRPFDTF